MGATGVQGFAGAVGDGTISLKAALKWHLRNNHYPPLPLELIPLCEKVIEMAKEIVPDDDNGTIWDTEIDLPNGITNRDGGTTTTVGEALQELHLDAFVLVDIGAS